MPSNRTSRWSLAAAMTALGLASLGLQAQPMIPASGALPSSAADPTKPGFIWRISQVTASQPNSNARTESQLAGELGPNVADPYNQGIALAPATAPDPLTAPIEFEIETVINMDPVGGSYGNFTPDDPMPGLPGTVGGNDYAAAEILTWLDLPAGEITMGVNSDDGFRMSIGGPIPSDRFVAVTVGEYDGGRGAGDTIFKFKIEKAGLYATRVTWENGTGDANIEWFSVKADGTTVLVNDVANGGYKAYRAVTGSTKAYIRNSIPLPNAAGVAPNTPIEAELVDGGTPIDPATVKLSLDGVALTRAASKVGNVTSISYQPAKVFAGGSKHQVSLSYTEAGTVVTVNWSFTVAGYAVLAPSLKVTADTTKRGFVWSVFANAANTENSLRRAEFALAGLLVDADGNALPNLADPAAQGAALAAATAPTPANARIKFEIAEVINLSHTAGDANGNFPGDRQMPGVPATDGSTDGVAAELITYLDLPAGIITMGINSDDNFRTFAGTPLDVPGAILVGEYERPAGRTAGDTIFNFEVQEPGVYAFRTLYEQSTATANIEWFTVKPDGTKVLVNDTANGGVKAYRAVTGSVPPYLRMVDPATTPRQLNQISWNLKAVLEDGTTAVDDASVALTLDAKPVTVTKTRQGKEIVVTYQPDSLVIPDEVHTAQLTYKDTAGGATRTATWKFRNLKNLVLPTPAILETFDSYEEGSVPTGWVAQNFTRSNVAGVDLNNLNSDAYLGWVVVTRERLEPLKTRIFNVAPGQTLNGQPVTSLSEGSLLYAESDVRGGDQVQFLISKPFNLSQVTNVVLSFASLYEQNQDNLGAVEYSVDGGNHWLPVVYYLDFVDGGGDIKLNSDGTVDAIATMTAPNTDTAAWVDNGVQKGDKYGDGILAPLTDALGAYIVPRWNDNSTIDKRVEVFRLPQAGKQADVRLRFSQLGTGSWYFGVDNLGFYEGPAPVVVEQPKLNNPTLAGSNVILSWTGGGTLLEAPGVTGPWTTSASQANPQTVPAAGAAKFYRVMR